ncbi:MAG: CPBP family intramembrane metalloprotease [Bdellovibrionales bacterium]|nr:CPBP family intramembrane metalloprotease [Bdellovibrionales bacterium]
MKINKIFFCLACFLFTSSVAAQSIFDHKLKDNFEKPRSTFWAPLASVLLPGMDQWWEKQWSSAGIYSGMAISGYTIMLGTARKDEFGKSEYPDLGDINDLAEWGDRERKFILGGQLVQVAGSLSAYQSFRTAAHSHGSKYNFLPKNEDTGDILLAPFKFEHLLRPTTYIPLSIFALLVSLDYSGLDNPTSINIDDSGLIGAMSYGAGTGEEAMFRGWLMPMFYEKMDNYFWSNTTTAALFGAAHLSSYNQLPIGQTLIGWYLGWVTQRNGWSVQESVFIHAWWDVIAFSYAYFNSNSDKEAYLALPPFRMSF